MGARPCTIWGGPLDPRGGHAVPRRGYGTNSPQDYLLGGPKMAMDQTEGNPLFWGIPLPQENNLPVGMVVQLPSYREGDDWEAYVYPRGPSTGS